MLKLLHRWLTSEGKMTKHCPYCNADFISDMAKCPHCGASLPSANASPPVVPSPHEAKKDTMDGSIDNNAVSGILFVIAVLVSGVALQAIQAAVAADAAAKEATTAAAAAGVIGVATGGLGLLLGGAAIGAAASAQAAADEAAKYAAKTIVVAVAAWVGFVYSSSEGSREKTDG